MNKIHINEIFNFFAPNETQIKNILREITRHDKRKQKKYLPKKPVVAVCSLIVILVGAGFAVAQNKNKKMKLRV